MTSDYKMGVCGPSVGAVTLGGQALLAPLSGVTDVVFRRIAHRLGASLVVSEMVAADDYVQGDAEARIRAEGRGIAPHVVQLAGCEPRWMAEAAKMAEANGAAIIDINMGCPAKRVTGGYAGSALMRNLDLATALIKATVQAVSVPVTVKMRLGWDERSLNAAELAQRAQDLGARAVSVHGRTRQQFYKGRADWAGIADVVRAVHLPVIANGDVGSTETARECLRLSQAAAVMVGRAAVGQPWLVGQIAADLQGRAVRSPSPAAKAEVAVEHYEGLLSLLGRSIATRHARKHLAAYAACAREAGYGLVPADRDRLVTTDDPAVAIGLLQRLYEDAPDRRIAA
ncbi:MAG: tRNA-dihydrouridine synthase DusB [uncultured Microvirga sp.]|uniref:tRNA-dihydrouridine synthase n=1 Tax=uncultured Microvirga sp. TaxID=412392 RepID=A0A6J4MPS4_9HYPH|nr:MAG: tRNA-dihydrouridine synthase DusB [uncultured Microvirga sp.]